jgi:energy-coupling factor transporter ATP-binding protein EcfA2
VNSDGERQFKNIKMALLMRPKILILDEATNSIDRKSLQAIGVLLRDFVNNGNTLISVNHTFTDVEISSCEISLSFFNS